MGLWGLLIFFTGDFAVVCIEERGGVKEDGDEIVGETLGKVGGWHVPTGVLRSEGDLGGYAADVIVIA